MWNFQFSLHEFSMYIAEITSLPSSRNIGRLQTLKWSPVLLTRFPECKRLEWGFCLRIDLNQPHFGERSLVGRAGFEPATVRFLHVSLVGWVTPTMGRHLQRLRQPNLILNWLGSSARLSYRPIVFLQRTERIYAFWRTLGSLGLRQSTRFT